MRTVTAEQLARAYSYHQPQEGLNPNNPDVQRIFQNWLDRLTTPKHGVAMSNWCGKVTFALFTALGMRQPKTKADTIKALQGAGVMP